MRASCNVTQTYHLSPVMMVKLGMIRELKVCEVYIPTGGNEGHGQVCRRILRTTRQTPLRGFLQVRNPTIGCLKVQPRCCRSNLEQLQREPQGGHIDYSSSATSSQIFPIQ